MIVDADDGSTQNFTQLVYDGWYGWPLENDSRALYVESEGGDSGDPIYFYIGDINTTQSVTFVPGGATNLTLTIADTPRILADNSDTSGTTGDPFTFNVTIGEYVDSGAELTVKVNWTHGTHTGFVNNNDTMICTGGDNINGFYFEKTITLDNYSIADLVYTIYVNDTSGNSNSSGPHTVSVADNDPPATTLEVGSPRQGSFVTTSTPIYLNATDNCNDWFIHYRIWNVTSGWSPWHVGNKNTNITITFTEECTHYIEYYANDTSILNNTGTTHNTTFYVDDTPPISSIEIGNPKYGYSLYFDGSNDYVDCGNDSSLDLTDNFTIEAWIKPYSFSFDAGIVSKYQELGHKGYVLRLANAEPYNRINFRGVLGSTLLQAKKWYHVVAVVKNGIAYLYLNGTLDGSGSFGDIVVNEDILTIGVDYLQSPRYFHGLIDDVRIYNKPLTQAEILSNYLGNVVTDGLVSWWKFNEGTGNTAYDSADNNNGTIHGATHISYLTSSTPIWINATDNGTSPCIVGSVDLNVSIYSFQTGNWTYYETHVDNGTASINFTIPEECRHWINITATDDLGNTVYQNTTVHVDNTPPTTTMTIGSPKYTSSGDTYITSSTTITLTTADGGSCAVGVNHTYYRINGSSWVEYTSPFTISDEGSHTIEWYSVDYLGNMESTHSYTVYVDDSSPTTTLSIDSPRYPSSSDSGCNVTSSTLFTLSASDNPVHGSGVAFTWYTIDGDYYVGTSFTLSGYSQGSHTITYGSQDNLGNNESGNSITVWVDDSAPTTSLAIGSPNYPSGVDGCNVTSSTVFTLSATDNPTHNSGVAFSWYRDNGVYHVYSGPFTLSGEGQHVITYGSQDNLGNNETGNSITVWVDDSPPTTVLTAGLPKYGSYVKSNTVFYLNATDAGHVDSYMIYYRVWWNGAWSSWVNGTWDQDLTFTLSEECTHYIEYYARDRLGNEETHHNETFYVDNTGPTVTMDSLSAFNNNNFTVSWSGTDIKSGVKSYTVQYKENTTGNWTDWLTNVSYTSATWDIDNTTEGCTVYFRALAVDNLGNIGSFSSNVSTTKDTTKPISTVNAISSYWQNNSPITITANASDSTSGVKNVTLYYYWNETSNSSADFEGPYEFDVDDTTPWSWSFNFPKGRGYYRFYSIAVDNAGNAENPPLVNDTGCYYNNTPPNMPSSPSPANGTTFSTGNRPSKLSWTGGDVDNDNVTYTIYLRKGNSTLTSSYILGNTTSTNYGISVDWNSKYYWKIVATDEHGAVTEGPVWWFKTGAKSSGGETPTLPANQPPVADASGPYSGYVGYTLSFSASDSYDPDGSIVNYSWNFGDGNIGYGMKSTHVYTAAGTFNVILTVTDNDGLTNTTKTTAVIKLDTDGDGWSDEEEQQYGTDPNNETSLPKDTDDDHLPDTVDNDDDNDGLPDDVEETVDSNPKNKTNFTLLNIGGTTSYLIDANNDGVYDKFYSTSAGIATATKRNEDGTYSIDVDGDGNMDYIYDPALGGIKPYEKPTQPFEIPWILILIVVIVGAIAVLIVYLYKRRYI